MQTRETAAVIVPRALDLGSGPAPAAGYVGVDLCPADEGHEVVIADLMSGEPWPFESGSVERLRAHHVIEHIPHGRVETGARIKTRGVVRSPGRGPVTHIGSMPVTQDTFFWFFDEAWRVAAPGCRFELAWPHPQSDGADQDPTHQRRIPSSTLHYLSRAGRRALRVHQYPVGCDWQIVPGSVLELATDAELARFQNPDGSFDIARAKREHGVFHEIVATLYKPEVA